jgi:hypothetical protein
MGKVAIVNTKTGEKEIFDAEKDSTKLMIRMLETGVCFQAIRTDRPQQPEITNPGQKSA